MTKFYVGGFNFSPGNFWAINFSCGKNFPRECLVRNVRRFVWGNFLGGVNFSRGNMPWEMSRGKTVQVGIRVPMQDEKSLHPAVMI